MIVYRLCKDTYKYDLSGEGARRVGGRWNSKGTSLVYASESRALCVLEVMVHLPLGFLPKKYTLVAIEIPDHITMDELSITDMPVDWKEYPHPSSTQHIGDEFSGLQRSAVLKVPSAIVESEYNYLINPGHSDSRAVKVVNTTPFSFDKRFIST